MSITMKTYTYKVVGDLEIQADVYAAGRDVPHPAIMWIHGGALIAGSRSHIPPQEVEMYVGAGYTVVSVDYRLAPETKLAQIIEDVRDAHRWLGSEGPRLFGIDPGRIAATGGSAGGYLTLMTGFCVEPRPKALVSVSGYGDIAGEWYSRPDPFYCTVPVVPKAEAYGAVGGFPIADAQGHDERGRFYLYCRQHGLWPIEVTGHDPDAEPEWFEAFCPVRNVTAEYPPTLLVHGDADTDVPHEQSVMMSAELARAGVEHEFITIEGGGHCSLGLDQAAVAASYERIMTFLEEHLE